MIYNCYQAQFDCISGLRHPGTMLTADVNGCCKRFCGSVTDLVSWSCDSMHHSIDCTGRGQKALLVHQIRKTPASSDWRRMINPLLCQCCLDKAWVHSYHCICGILLAYSACTTGSTKNVDLHQRLSTDTQAYRKWMCCIETTDYTQWLVCRWKEGKGQCGCHGKHLYVHPVLRHSTLRFGHDMSYRSCMESRRLSQLIQKADSHKRLFYQCC